MSNVKNKISRMLLNPEYTREDRAAFAGFLRPLLFLFLLLSGFSTLVLLLADIQVGVLIESASFILFLAAFVLHTKKRTTAAALMVLYTVLASFLASLLFGRETYYVAAFLFPIVLLLGSVFLSRKVYGITIAASIVLFAAASLESYHLYIMPSETEEQFANIFVALVLILVSMVTVNLFTNMLYRVFRAARENEEKFKIITEKLKVGIYTFSSSGKFDYVNKFMCTLLGYTEDELLSMNYIDFVHPDDKVIVQDRGTRRLDGDKVVNGYEMRSLRKDGTPLWVFISAAKVDVAEKKLGVGALFDIQQRKNLEREVLEEKEQLAITLRSIDEGVIVTDLSGGIILLNRAACPLAGIKQEEGIGKHINSIFTSVEIDGKAGDSFFRMLKDNVYYSRVFEGLFGVAGSSAQRFLSVSLTLLENERSEQKGYVIVVKDITEAKKVEENTERLEKLEALGLLAGGIAHDFNNILTGIMGNIDLLRLYLRDSEDSRIAARLEDAEKASSRAVELTRQLLTFSKGGSPVKDITSLPRLVEDTVSFILTGSNVTYSIEYPDDLWFADVDHIQISQVIQNLAMNSKQAMEKEGGSVTVFMENFVLESDEIVSGLAVSKGRYVRIMFSDNGPGILPEVLSKIFDPYFTTKETGNGLGLATVYSVIQQHGGYIGVESDVDQGTVFSIYLAAAQTGAALRDKKSMDSSGQVLSFSEKNPILIMDDEEIVRSVAAEMLSVLGFEPVQVSGGEECVQEYRERFKGKNPFSAVILDLTIPGGKGGRETAADILKVDPAASLIAISGYTNNSVLANFKEYGFSAVLRKPFFMEELENCLNNLVL